MTLKLKDNNQSIYNIEKQLLHYREKLNLYESCLQSILKQGQSINTRPANNKSIQSQLKTQLKDSTHKFQNTLTNSTNAHTTVRSNSFNNNTPKLQFKQQTPILKTLQSKQSHKDLTNKKGQKKTERLDTDEYEDDIIFKYRERKNIFSKYNEINYKMEEFFCCKKKKDLNVQSQFYEGIYLIGIDELKQSGSGKAKILFKYKESRYQNIETILPNILFPYGIHTALKSMNDSMSEVNALLYKRYIAENNIDCFVLPIKTEYSFTKDKIINERNPNNFLYCICYQIDDVIELDQDDYDFAITRRILCIITFVPYFKHSKLIIIINIIDAIKNEKFYQSTEKKILKNQDFLVSFLSSLKCQQILQKIPQQIPSFIDQIQNNPNIEASLNSIHLFSKGTTPQLALLILIYLLEHSIIFIANEVGILASIALMFLHMILPLKWLHPFICGIPHDSFELLQMPVPLFGGIQLNDEDANYRLNDLAIQHTNITFVQLSQNALNIFNVYQQSKLQSSRSYQFLLQIMEKCNSRIQLEESISQFIKYYILNKYNYIKEERKKDFFLCEFIQTQMYNDIK